MLAMLGIGFEAHGDQNPMTMRDGVLRSMRGGGGGPQGKRRSEADRLSHLGYPSTEPKRGTSVLRGSRGEGKTRSAATTAALSPDS